MKLRVVFIFFILSLLTASIAYTEEPKEIGLKKDAQVIHPPRGFMGEGLQDVVFEGEVLERLDSMGIWSGYIDSFQRIRYKVLKVTQGPVEKYEIIVHHVLVYGSALCEKTPQLSHEIFRVGNTLMITAKKTAEGDYVGWEQAENAIVIKAAQAPAKGYPIKVEILEI